MKLGAVDKKPALPRFYINKKTSEIPEQLKLLEVGCKIVVRLSAQTFPSPAMPLLSQVSRELHLTQKTAESVENAELELLWTELQKFASSDDKVLISLFVCVCVCVCVLFLFLLLLLIIITPCASEGSFCRSNHISIYIYIYILTLFLVIPL